MEVSYLAEILTNYAIGSRLKLLIDGSLADVNWFGGILRDLRGNDYKRRSVCVIYVTGEKDTVWTQIEKRQEETGRLVPRQVFERGWKAMQTVFHETQFFDPVQNAEAPVDVFIRIFNPGFGANQEPFLDHISTTNPRNLLESSAMGGM